MRDVEGHETGPPAFVGLGAMRCGTSWLYELLMQHPESFDAGPKERHFFDGFAARPFTEDDVTLYRESFARPPGAIVGEITPRYMSDFWTPALLRRAAPDARLFVVLRDPVQRFLSARRLLRPKNYALLKAMGHFPADDTEGRKGFELPPEILASDSMQRGQYHAQIRQILRHFPGEQLLVLQFEQAVADPVGAYRQMLHHIGFDDVDFVPAAMNEAVGSSRDGDERLDRHLRDALVEVLEDDVARLGRDFGDQVDLSLWPNFSHLA